MGRERRKDQLGGYTLPVYYCYIAAGLLINAVIFIRHKKRIFFVENEVSIDEKSTKLGNYLESSEIKEDDEQPGELKEKNIISEYEFDQKKEKLLSIYK